MTRLFRSSLIACAAAAVAQAADTPGDSAHGRVLFQQSCSLCHGTGLPGMPPGGQGPLLAGVMGRAAAAVPSFGYSRALRGSNLTWDAATLDRFLTAPQNAVPGTLMVVAVPSADDRRDIIAFLSTLAPVSAQGPESVKGPAAPSSGDWRNDAPGVKHAYQVADLPPPFSTESAGNSPSVVDRPEGARLSVPAGFSVEAFATGLRGPRRLLVAPNGDLFVAETGAGNIRVLRSSPGQAHPDSNDVYARGLEGPFGLAFYPSGPNPQWLYVGLLNQVIRYPYHNGDRAAAGEAQVVVPRLAPHPRGGHTTRDLAFSLDGTRMFISLGSGSNVAQGLAVKSPEEIHGWEAEHGLGAAWDAETNRAVIMVTDPEGKAPLHNFATGIRNPVGIAVDPWNGELWCSTNERDALGDNLVPDYVTHVQEGGFYGWPWYYLGNHEDPRHAGERPDLAGKAIVPDVLLQSHSASLQLAFYTATSGVAAFPSDYHGDIFACEHGSWNRATRTGSKVIRIHLQNGVASDYEDFMTGFIVDNSHVWGRPVGVAVANDGALIVSDDAGDVLWRIAPSK
ncbi:MAG TPA: PQQ-dependent sugar dehydrogenase [Opitutaceae bacterium]|jgi:hypothetical protein